MKSEPGKSNFTLNTQKLLICGNDNLSIEIKRVWNNIYRTE